MKYFVIHSGKDYKRVENLMKRWSEEYENIQFVVLEGSQENWEGDATARIRESQKVLYLVGSESSKSPYIQIEIDIANRENKEIYVFPLEKDNPVNDCLKRSQNETKKGEFEGEILISKSNKRIFILDRKGLDAKLKKDSEEIEKSLRGFLYGDKETLMEQYKMFVETSEELVRRKQSVNTFYVSLNSLMLGAVVSILTAGDGFLKGEINHLAVCLLSAFLAIMGLVICISWITLLNSYGDLNASKMAIIGCIEEHLALKLYDTEWALLTRRIGNRKYRSFTVKEVGVAKIFMGLYGFVLIACAVLAVFF